jgi:type IV pilus assembly protein PilY1
MKKNKAMYFRAGVASLICASFTIPLYAGKTDIASVPISSLTGAATPEALNLMFMIDDSTSMLQDWVPFNLGSDDGKGYKAVCRQSTGSCNFGDPPRAAAQINGLAYDPRVTYKAPVDADGTNTTFQSYSTPASWTKVRKDPFSDIDSQRPSPDTTTINLLTEFPEPVYCKLATDDPKDENNCKRNGTGYQRGTSSGTDGTKGGVGYPDATYSVMKIRLGAPYYYVVDPLEYCKDAALRQCGSATKTATYSYEAYVRYCNSSLAVALAAGKTDEWTYDPLSDPPTKVCQRAFNDEGKSGTTRQFIQARYGSFRRVDIDVTSAKDMENFANWYAYYRTKLAAMKSSLAGAMLPLNQSYRVGYMGSFYDPTMASSKLLPVQQFDATGKGLWYRTIFGHPHINGSGTGTNLVKPASYVGQYINGKLTKDGRVFRKESTKVNITIPDPVTSSCQANYMVLVTDGAQNDIAWTGANKIDGITSVGDQDGPTTGAVAPYCGGCKNSAVNVTSNTLADVTSYLYKTDLRPDLADEVRATQTDAAPHQHLTTYTLTFGVGGTLTWVPNYESVIDSDFQQIQKGNWDWPQTNITDPNDSTKQKISTAAAIDDTWHAAVNGHGKYFSVNSANSFAAAISSIVNSLTISSDQTAAGVTTSSTVLQSGSFGFISEFRNMDWYGDLARIGINPETGDAVRGTDNRPIKVWSAQAQSDATAPTTRNIYMADYSSSAALKKFDWSLLTASEQANFTKWTALSHYSTLTADQQSALTGKKLIDYLRGDRTNEAVSNDLGANDVLITSLFRKRLHVLGDITTESVYVSAPNKKYVDAGYQAWAAKLKRTDTVYVGANDGMLHAFDAATGQERWAFVPSAVLGKLYKLADKNYSTDHQFYVAGQIVVRDVCVDKCGTSDAKWISVLVGGLGAGGRGYFALDVTGDTPTLLWEFSAGTTCISTPPASGTSGPDCDLGYTYGNPVITKNADGVWVVVFGSGYNNGDNGVTGDPVGTGNGFIYALDVYTGKVLNKVATGVGSKTDPSGLAKLTAWVEDPASDNTALRLYGGDLKGNLWRIEGPGVSSALNVVKLASLVDAQGNNQPITTKPELGLVDKNVMVFVGTGQLLGASDLTNQSQQSFYGIKDDLSSSPNIKRSNLVSQSVGVVNSVRTTTSLNSVDLNAKSGWVVDLNQDGSSPGERVHTDAKLNLGTLTFTTYQPPANKCSQGTAGNSFLYDVNFATGAVVGGYSIPGLISTATVVQTTSNKIVDVYSLTTGNTIPGSGTDVGVGGARALGQTTGRRISWREIITK